MNALNLTALPKGWHLGEIRVRMLCHAEQEYTEITLCTDDHGSGAFITMATEGRIALKPGELKRIAEIGEMLIAIVEASSVQ